MLSNVAMWQRVNLHRPRDSSMCKQQLSFYAGPHDIAIHESMQNRNCIALNNSQRTNSDQQQ